MLRRNWYVLAIGGAMMAPLLRKRSWMRWTMATAGALAGGYAIADEFAGWREAQRTQPPAPVSVMVLSDPQAVFAAAREDEMLQRMFPDAPRLKAVASTPPDEVIWASSEEGARMRGRFSFRPGTEGRGTKVELKIEEAPARFRSRRWAHQSLSRLKQWIETGEIATTDGQPQGPRSPLAVALEVLAELPSVAPESDPRPREGAA